MCERQMQVKNERCNVLFSAFGIFMKPGFGVFWMDSVNLEPMLPLGLKHENTKVAK